MRRSEVDAAVRSRLAAVAAARSWVPAADLGLQEVSQVEPESSSRGDWSGPMATTAARLWRDLPDDAAPDPAGEFTGWSRPGGRHARDHRGLIERMTARCRAFRFDPGRRPALVVLAVAVAAVLVTVVLVWRSRPEPAALGAAPTAVPSSSSAAAPAPSVPPSSASGLVVAVTGKVRRPGLVHLRPGARVADAIQAAGGLRPGADIGLLNLAQVLTDGEQVLVGIDGAGAAAPAGGAASGSAAAGPIHLNTATAEQLDTLPGVGEVTAQKIIDYRTAHGPFRSVDALQDVPGIGPAHFAEIAPLVTL